MKSVLITGMSGLIGGLLRTHLEGKGGYELSALNRRDVAGVECHQADIADLEAIKPAFEGKDVVVHLSAMVVEEPWKELLSTNIVGTYNVYQAARLAGVKRVVFASSGSTIKGWERMPPYAAMVAGRYDELPASWPMITHDMVWPLGLYGASKVWGEAVGRHFSNEYDMSILCVRISSVRSSGRPETVMDRSIYLSHRDVVTILEKCIDAPEDLRYDIFMAASRNRYGYRDLAHAKEVLGWEPADSVDSFR